MATLVERLLGDLLRATTDNSRFLKGIASSIQQEQGEKTPQGVRLYNMIGISGSTFQVPHPSALVDTVTIHNSLPSSGLIAITTAFPFDVEYMENILGQLTTYTTEGRIISPFQTISPGNQITVSTNDNLYLYCQQVSTVTSFYAIDLSISYYTPTSRSEKSALTKQAESFTKIESRLLG